MTLTKGSKHNNTIHNFNIKSPYSLDTDNNECWNWTGCVDKDGYGVFTLDKKKTPAHVVAYKLALGNPEPGNYILHKCNNASCVNPNHLYEGTQKQNIQDQIDAGTFVYGSKNGKALLTEDTVMESRKSSLSCKELANLHQVSYYTMWDALKGRTWKHVK